MKFRDSNKVASLIDRTDDSRSRLMTKISVDQKVARGLTRVV